MNTNPTQFKMMNTNNNPTLDPTTVQNLMINFVDSNGQDIHTTLGWLSNSKSIITIRNCIQNQLFAQFQPTNVNTFGSEYQVSVTFLNSNGGNFVAGDMYNFINTPPYTLGNLQDVNVSNKSDKKIVMYNQNTQHYNTNAYTETTFAFNISTDTQISYAFPGRFKFLNSSRCSYFRSNCT